MKHRKSAAAVAAAVGAALVSTSGAETRQTGPAASVQRQLDEANRALTYQGQPINPRAVQELGVWISDSEAGPVAINLAGTHKSNRYFGEYSRDKDGRTKIDLSTTEVVKTDENKGFFSYQRLGTLPGGIHVLETAESGGGTGVFMSLLLVQFAVDFEYDENGARKNRLIMRRMGEIALGDRYDGTVTVKGNTIEIGADKRHAKKARIIRFP